MSLFDNQGTQTTNQGSFLDKLTSEKGEQWKDPETLAKGYINSQEMIESLKTQVAEMQEDLSKEEHSKKLLERLDNIAKPNEPNDPTNTTSVTGDEIKNLVKEAITSQEVERTAEGNLLKAEAELQKLHGSNASDVLKQRSQELGMSMEKLQEIAQTSPTAFLELMGQPKTEAPKTPNRSTINTMAPSFENTSNDRTYAYYQELRRTDKKRYYSPSVQNQMMKDRQSMGEKFYN